MSVGSRVTLFTENIQARQGISRRREICFRLVRHISGLYVCRVTREELLKLQLTDEQRKILSDYSALYNRLPSNLKTKLEGLMHVFLHEVAFEVKGFDKVTEEVTPLVRKNGQFVFPLRVLPYNGSSKKAKTQDIEMAS